LSSFCSGRFVRSAVIALIEMLQDSRTAGLVKLRCGVGRSDQGRLWAEGGHSSSFEQGLESGLSFRLPARR